MFDLSKVETWDVEVLCGNVHYFERVTVEGKLFPRGSAEAKAVKRVQARLLKLARALDAVFVGEGFCCRRCSECTGQDHHWSEGLTDEGEDGPLHGAEYGCKHCAALGAEATLAGHANDEGVIVVVGVTRD